MSVIKIMSRELSNRIAAGEVIERPASVVKELIENAIDAGASQVDIAIEKAGLRLISVSDNGCGMDSEDALLALEPHGTSKLIDEKGIDNISTMGFRGEAIPSVASVSRFSLRTRETGSSEGTLVEVDGGEIKRTSPCGCAAGTVVEVRDLFFNTPARRKFLKSNPTEERHIEDIVLSLALGNPEIGFTLSFDRKKVIDCAAKSSVELRIREFFGRNYAANMCKVAHLEGDIRVSGMIATPGFTRPGRKEQRFYLNRRPVESQALWRGIKDGYGTLADEAGRFPPAVLFVDMPTSDFDINVHPAKREVRFKSDFNISRIISAAVSMALRSGGTLSTLPPAAAEPALPETIPVEQILAAAQIVYAPAEHEQTMMFLQDSEKKEADDATDVVSFVPEIYPSDNAPEINISDDEPVPEVQPAVKIRARIPEESVFCGNWPEEVLGVYDNTYILASSREGLVLVDQHAAHERILFEEICGKLASGSNVAQPLLIGQMVELTPGKIALLDRCRKVLVNIGFDFENIGRNSIMINSLPENFNLPPGRIPEVFDAMMDELLENSKAQLPVDLEFAARAACKAAVKAHHVLSVQEANLLLRQLKSCRQGTLCPHGRPTMITLSLRELERRFGRK